MKTAAEMAKLADEAALELLRNADESSAVIAEDLMAKIEEEASNGYKRITGLRYCGVESSDDVSFKGALAKMRSLGYVLDYLDDYDEDLGLGYVWIDIYWGGGRG